MSAILSIGTSNGVFVLGETPGEWKLMGQGLTGRSITCVQPGAEGQLWVGTEKSGLHYTSDMENWQPAVNELSGTGIYSLVFHPKQSKVMLCGTAPASLHLSLDGGKKFQELPSLRQHPSASNWSYPEPPYRSRLHRLFLHPTDLDVVCAAVVSGGFYLSGDVGQSWHERSKGLGRVIHDLAGHPLLPGRLYACSPIGFYLTEDLGESWHERSQGLAYLHTGCLAVHPEEPNIVFLASHRNAQGGGAIYRSPNAGQRWESCEGLPFAADLRFTCMAIQGSYFAVATNKGELFMSRDLGSTWGKIRTGMSPISCLSLKTN